MKRSKNLKKKIIHFAIAIFMLIMTFRLSTAFFPPARSLLNTIYKSFWHITAPESYYIQFTEARPGVSNQWELYVENGEIIWKNSIIDHPNGGSFSVETVSVDDLFTFTEDECIIHGFLKCGIGYHDWYKYPEWVDSYPDLIFRVEEFINCTKYPDLCQEKINPPNGGDN